MRKLLGALAIAGLAMIVSAPGADAACWWNGFTWVCTPPPYAGPWRPYWRHPYPSSPYWREAWRPWRYHRDWRYWYERPYAWYR